jgi:hypothetical protein
MIQPVLPLHECATESVADPTTVEPLHSIADPAAAAPTEISYLCVQV